MKELLLRLTRLYPFYKGRGRLALSSFLRHLPSCESAIVETSLSTGERIFVFEDDYIGRMVRFFGDLDPALSEVVRGLLRRGDIAIDVGANVGVVSLSMASAVGPQGHVFAFEPLAPLAELLARSATTNAFSNITVFNAALSATKGQGSMRVHASNLGVATLERASGGVSCEIRTLDEMDFGARFRRPRLVKIDVEGHEAEVLEGARSFLERFPPDFVVFESHRDKGPFHDRSEVAVLRDYGYSFQGIFRSALCRAVLRPVPSEDQPFPATYDFLATRDRAGRRR